MQFSGEGYIIKIKSHGETSAIITLVCPNKGKIVGYVKGAYSKRNLATYQLGNYISFNAYARVEENMLSLRGVELLHSHVADFVINPNKINALSSLCHLVDQCVAENDDLGKLYISIDNFFRNICQNNWLVYYSFFEYDLLDFLGIGLDTGKCAVTGTKNNLRYISPKTGRAVCAEVGEPYKDKLYSYPHYIINHNFMPQINEVGNVLKMTGNFLSKNFLTQHNMELPEKRAKLLDVMRICEIRL